MKPKQLRLLVIGLILSLKTKFPYVTRQRSHECSVWERIKEMIVTIRCCLPETDWKIRTQEPVFTGGLTGEIERNGQNVCSQVFVFLDGLPAVSPGVFSGR